MKTKYAYMAGLLDGEGYIGLCRYNHGFSYKTRVVIANCNLELLEWARDNFGGYITKLKTQGNWTQGYKLQIGYLEKWLPEVIPYMVGKKKKAQLLMEARNLLNERKKRTNQAGELNLKRLNEIDLLLREKEWLI